MAPNFPASAASTCPRPSARQISVSAPPPARSRAAAASQSGSVSGEAAWAARRPGSGEDCCATLNGGFINTQAADPGAIPAAAKSAAVPATSRRTARTRSDKLLSSTLRLASAVSSGSMSTSVTVIPAMRRANANPAPPTPAPRSTAWSPGRAAVAAASRIASWPTRWPRIGCRIVRRQPRTASSLSPLSTGIGTQLVTETSFGEELPCRGELILADHDAPLKGADRSLQHADVLIDHQMADGGALEQRFDRRNQDRIIGANELAHGSAPPPFFARRAQRQIRD